MDIVLRRFLPEELIDIISRLVWRLNIQEAHVCIRYKVIWVRHEDKNTFLVCEHQNYYKALK